MIKPIGKTFVYKEGSTKYLFKIVKSDRRCNALSDNKPCFIKDSGNCSRLTNIAGSCYGPERSHIPVCFILIKSKPWIR